MRTGPGGLLARSWWIIAPEIGPGGNDLAVVVAGISQTRGWNLRRVAEAFSREHRAEMVDAGIQDRDLDPAPGIGYRLD